jgi:hypothetical protein
MRRTGISGIVGGIALMVLVGCAGSLEGSADGQSSTDRAKGISSAFMCDCGRCMYMRLDDCFCPDAEAAKMYIRQLLARDKYSREEILSKVDSRYGGLRADAKKKPE